jgi:hypothetical protein
MQKQPEGVSLITVLGECNLGWFTQSGGQPCSACCVIWRGTKNDRGAPMPMPLQTEALVRLKICREDCKQNEWTREEATETTRVIEQQGKPAASVPAALQSRSGPPPLAPQPGLFARSKARWGIAMLLTTGFVAGIVVWGVDPDPNRYMAASSWTDRTVRLETVSCVSVRWLMYDGKPYWEPDLTAAIADILKIKTVFGADDTTCPWSFSGAAEPRTNTEIKYNGYWARYTVSVGICEKGADGHFNPSRCLNKTVYVFTPRVSPWNLFRIGLTGLARPQARDLEAFQLSK